MPDEIRKEVLYGFDGKGIYAIEKPDVLPPIDSLRPLNEKGEFVDKKIETKADNAYYWRSKARLIGVIMLISSVGMLVILLGAADKYQQWVFDLIALPFQLIVKTVFGLVPKLW